MILTKPTAIGLGRTALALLDIEGQVGVLDPDPYNDTSVVKVEIGDGDWQEQVHLGIDSDSVEAVIQIANQISEYISESSQYWGVQFPRCPGHVHAAEYDFDDVDLWLICPQTGAEIRRVTV